MFIDNAKILVRAGSGGKGCESYYRDKYTRRGIPNGGEGGRGADIIIKADRNLSTLLDFKYNQHFFGKHGEHGSGKDQKGKNASPIIIRVPCGTVIKDLKSDCVLRDLKADQESLVVARGGKGGLGNKHNRVATPGEPGEERELLLDLNLIADVGIVGFPNAGKSTLISQISNAHSQVAAYPFTTKFPVLGVVGSEREAFTIADIPGLIEGSSHGRGLGDKFLRHVQRTKILVHLVDISGSEGRDPIEDYRKINQELKNYSKEVAAKPQIIAANKIDLEGADEQLARWRKVMKKKIYPISALKKEGLEELIDAIRKKL
ncbi:MAG: GTPase ObgE [Candidatus Omnitrophica bacterium]|nr:GTPase ObgE [Candidatus Omnitrophota bacterium]MDD5653440.1 GTPase ObgE [Candidatus Omnitrophota bacterium]